MDQEGWKRLGACGSKEHSKGFEGATLLVHLHGKGPRVEMPKDMACQERTTRQENSGLNCVMESEHIIDSSYKGAVRQPCIVGAVFDAKANELNTIE
jgi:hypothetical protein